VNGLRFALLLACFFLSGFAALIYQTAWTRQFAFVFGTSELAVATVLAAYMGGLAAGAVAAARFVGRVRRPVLVYGVLELGIALAALCVPAALGAATALYVELFGGSSDPADAGGLVAALFYLVSSGAILLVPTGLMGATLPLLARHAVRRESEIGSRVGLLYAINTVGAVAGAVGAGFVLLPRLGLLSTIHVGVAVNGLVFLAAALVARGAEPLAAPGPRSEAAPTTGGWILPMVMISGAVSFSYEVLWSRLLGHLLGGSVYGFATMLASFLRPTASRLRSWARPGSRCWPSSRRTACPSCLGRSPHRPAPAWRPTPRSRRRRCCPRRCAWARRSRWRCVSWRGSRRRWARRPPGSWRGTRWAPSWERSEPASSWCRRSATPVCSPSPSRPTWRSPRRPRSRDRAAGAWSRWWP
jgi:hypothetical protein